MGKGYKIFDILKTLPEKLNLLKNNKVSLF